MFELTNPTEDCGLPLFPKIFLRVTAVLCAWGLICSVPMIVIVLFVLTPKVFESPEVNQLGYVGWGVLILVLLLQVVFLAKFLLASIRLLRHSRRGLRSFRICLWTINGYLVLVAIGQLAAVVFSDLDFEPFVISIVTIASALAVIVGWASVRMIQCLSSERVQVLLD